MVCGDLIELQQCFPERANQLTFFFFLQYTRIVFNDHIFIFKILIDHFVSATPTLIFIYVTFRCSHLSPDVRKEVAEGLLFRFPDSLVPHLFPWAAMVPTESAVTSVSWSTLRGCTIPV